MAQFEPVGSRWGMSAESFSIEVVGSDVGTGVDIVVEGLDVDPEAEADTDVLAFWAGPII